jgi:glycerol transport system permease protein
MALPLLIPWNVVGTIWQIFGRADIGLLGLHAEASWASTTTTPGPVRRLGHHHRDGCLALDVAGGAAGLCRAGVDPRRLLPGGQDRRRVRWAVFRYIQLPKMKGVLTIAILLRFMDSFMIYTEPFVLTGGGPGNSTTLLSIDLVKMALGQFDLGPAAAMSRSSTSW